jgi:hypothetical protein
MVLAALEISSFFGDKDGSQYYKIIISQVWLTQLPTCFTQVSVIFVQAISTY